MWRGRCVVSMDKSHCRQAKYEVIQYTYPISVISAVEVAILTYSHVNPSQLNKPEVAP